MESVVIKMTIN